VSATIGATHVLCAIGRGTEQAWASARAGIARIGNSSVMDRNFEPIRMGLVPEDALPELPAPIDGLPLPSRARRILRLAAASLSAMAPALTAEVPMFIGLPALSLEASPWIPQVPEYLAKITGVRIDLARTGIVAKGRAAALIALQHALLLLQTDPAATVIVGGVDTFLDLRLLAELDAEGRILGTRVMDGFIPGEGAAFYLLHGPEAKRDASEGASVQVHGAVSIKDPGHRYGTEPAKGEGLALAVEQLRSQIAPLPAPVATTFAGFNGENFEAKLWGVAQLRHRDFLSPAMLMEHPADKFGDAGAAMGAILVALAAQALATGTRPGPALVWAASDREPRACAVLSKA
jgi:3-oxoacyl-[acyl-carrier-protein] synthase-1